MQAQWCWHLGTSATRVGGIINKRPHVCLFLSCDSTSDPLVRDSDWHNKCYHLSLLGSLCIRSCHELLAVYGGMSMPGPLGGHLCPNVIPELPSLQGWVGL